MERKKIATRAAYGQTLAELGEHYPEIVALDADLSGSTTSAVFGQRYPERFFNCGIAEANMIGIAAGLAATGFRPFASSFAMFSTGRVWEQIRNSVAYPALNVTVVGSHGGPSVGEDGATHQMNEDLSIMRSIPNMTVVCPCDAYEMRRAVEALAAHEGPAYLRLCRYPTEVVTDTVPGYSFSLGRGVTLREGKDITVAATGIMVPAALRAAESLEKEGVSVRVLDIHTIKPLDEELILKAAEETGRFLTVEEGSTVGGLGSAVCELLSEKRPTPVRRFGVPDVFGRSGSAAAMLDYYGLTPEGIAAQVRLALNA